MHSKITCEVEDEQCPRSETSVLASRQPGSPVRYQTAAPRKQAQGTEVRDSPRCRRRERTRSEQRLRSFFGGNRELVEFLQECREGYYQCNRPFCSLCARAFRRWFVGELLRVTKGKDVVRIYTVLLKEAPHDKIDALDPAQFRHQLRGLNAPIWSTCR